MVFLEKENYSANMNEYLLKRIKCQLNMKFYTMNDTWLRDCIEFFVRDKASYEMTDRHIFEFVESQWQLSDLREINNENGCLPKNLAQQVHTTLTGTYILQVNKIYDITSSKYKQLCEIRKISSKNVEVTEKEKLAEWEPKARRMMQLCLTDGIQDLLAIEYTPLKQLTNTLLPGYKVMIIGPLDCRRGVILLQDGKYKEIGGEVESLLKSNALENILARALGKAENADPYNDNGSSRILNQNAQNVQNATSDPSNENSIFNDDFEEIIDLDAVTAIERRSQQAETIQDRTESIRNQREMINKETEETMEDIDFESLENWSSPSLNPLRVLPVSLMETERSDDKDDIMIVEEMSASVCDSRNVQLPSASFLKKTASKFPDNFDDCDVTSKTEKSQSQGGNLLKNEIKMHPSLLIPKQRLANNDVPMEVKKYIFKEVSVTKDEKPTMDTLDAIQQIPKMETILNSVPIKLTKICDVLSDVSTGSITGRIYRTVRGQVKNHSALSKQGKCWAVTALITDHTSNIEVCFDSEIMEKFLGFTVQEFSQKKKLAKLDPQINNELRLNLRKAQHQIQNLDALLKLELIQDQMAKVVEITQLTQQ